MTICKGKLKDGTDCAYSINTKADPSGRFCARHKYLSEHTEEMLLECKHCSDCKRWIYLGEFKTCSKCRGRGKQNRKVTKEKKDTLPNCDACVANECKKIKKGIRTNDYGKNYCNLHFDMSTWLDKLEANDRKPCNMYNRKCLTKEGLPKDSPETRCEQCSKKTLSKSRENDKKRKERRKREKATGNTCVKCHKVFDDPLEFIDYRGDRTTKCIECRRKQMIYDRKARKLGIRKSYPLSKASKMRKRMWRENNREKMIEYCLKARAKKMQEMGEEYWKVRAQWQKEWRKQNPEKVIALNHKKKTDPKYKLKYYKDRAQRSNIQWKLTDEECFEYFKNCCYFCGDECGKTNNGIDRLDNSVGYTFENTVTCCEMCNMMKSNLSEDIFIERCRYILACNGLIDEDIPCTSAYPLRTCGTYPDYKNRAVSKKGIEFAITEGDYYNLINDTCYICGTETYYRHVNGIDRVTNDEGYIPDNVKTCCAECNYMKKAYDYDDFMQKISDIHNNHTTIRHSGVSGVNGLYMRKDMLSLYLYNESEECFIRTNYVIENVSLGEWSFSADSKDTLAKLSKNGINHTVSKSYEISSDICNIPYILFSQSHNKHIVIDPNYILYGNDNPSLVKKVNDCAILFANAKGVKNLILKIDTHGSEVVGITIEYTKDEFQDSWSPCKCDKCKEHWNDNDFCKCDRCMDHTCHEIIDECYWCSKTEYYQEIIRCPLTINVTHKSKMQYVKDAPGVNVTIGHSKTLAKYRKKNKCVNQKEYYLGMLSATNQGRLKKSKTDMITNHQHKIKVRKAERIKNYSNPEWRKERAKRIVRIKRAI
jgi:hypothetical protein